MIYKRGIIWLCLAVLLMGCESVSTQLTDIQLPDLSLKRTEPPADVVRAPNRQQVLPIPPSGIVTVGEGDTIFVVANRYQTYPQRIIEDNALQSPYTLTAGQQLRLTPPIFQIVRLGDSLYSLSQRYAGSQFQLADLNGLESPYALTVGQRLQLPGSYDLSVLDAAEKPIKTPAVISKPGTPVVTATPVAPAPKAPRKNFIAPTLTATDGFNWPVSGEVLQEFGPSERGVHNDGLNIAAEFGAPIQTAAPGTVAYVGENLKSFGTLVLVKHDGGYITAYAHLAEVTVSEGDVLTTGQLLGRVGATGTVDRPQLHFEIRRNRAPINPRELISG